jgi:hypothetical protein
MSFWDDHVSLSHVARKLGSSRQNVQQRVNRGSIPSARDTNGKIGVPIEWLNETLLMRERG